MQIDRQTARAEHSSFHGIVLPLVTPLLDRDVLDRAGLERLIEYVLAGGVHGLFLLGTTGEARCVSSNLRARIREDGRSACESASADSGRRFGYLRGRIAAARARRGRVGC